MRTKYTASFYRSAGADTPQSAAIVVPLIIRLLRPRSVVDVGCGSASWLAEFMRQGIDDVIGIDGPWIATDQLRIPADRFCVADLGSAIDVHRQFDVALCLETGEHLSLHQAPVLVRSLTSLAPVVVFSAAIPHQGGEHHVNEQWPGFWAELFGDAGYVFVDSIRHEIWTKPGVEWWYAQNMFVAVRREHLSSHPELLANAPFRPGHVVALVHPRAYAENVARGKSPVELLNATLGALRRSVLRRIVR